MSYKQHMKHINSHRHDKQRQPIIMSTGSGFWPSGAFLFGDYFPYVAECEAKGEKPMGCEEYYKSQLRR